MTFSTFKYILPYFYFLPLLHSPLAVIFINGTDENNFSSFFCFLFWRILTFPRLKHKNARYDWFRTDQLSGPPLVSVSANIRNNNKHHQCIKCSYPLSRPLNTISSRFSIWYFLLLCWIDFKSIPNNIENEIIFFSYSFLQIIIRSLELNKNLT